MPCRREDSKEIASHIGTQAPRLHRRVHERAAARTTAPPAAAGGNAALEHKGGHRQQACAWRVWQDCAVWASAKPHGSSPAGTPDTGAWTGEQNGYNLAGYHARDMAQSTSQHVRAHSIMRRCSVALILTLTQQLASRHVARASKAAVGSSYRSSGPRWGCREEVGPKNG